MKKFTVASPETKRMAVAFVQMLPLERPHDVTIQEHKDQRTLEQNRKMFAVLQDISDQVNWYGQKLSRYDWKAIFTASLKKQRAVPGIDGGFVVLGESTSRMSVAEMSDVIELALAFGVEHGVAWSDEARKL